MSSLASKLESYIAHRLPRAEDVRVQDFERIFGGASFDDDDRLRIACFIEASSKVDA